MTARQLARKMAGRAAAVEHALETAAEEISDEATELSRIIMRRGIYAIPEDRTSTGEKKWERTRRLIESEQARAVDVDLVFSNEAPYAEVRHEAGKPNRRAIDARRRSHWRDEAITQIRPRLLRHRQLALRRLLQKGSR